MLSSGSNKKDKKVQRAIILNCAESQVVKLAMCGEFPSSRITL